MDKNQFLKQLFEIVAGKKLSHTAQSYDSINLEVSITPEINGQNPIVVFASDHAYFPIIAELPLSDMHLMLGLTEIFIVEKTKRLKTGRKRNEMLKLIDEYVRSNKLLQAD